MKSITKLIAVLIASAVLFACSGGSSVKMVKVWKISEEAEYSDQNMTKLEKKVKNYYDNNGLLYKKEFIDEATGLVKSYREYSYRNSVVSKEEYYYRETSPFTASTPFEKSSKVLEMDEQGTVKFYSDGFTHDYVNDYDTTNPEQLKKRRLDKSSASLAVDYTMDYTFNNDNTVEVTRTRENSGSKYWRKFTYNKGNVESIEARRDSSTGTLLGISTFEYIDDNSDGRIDKHSYTSQSSGLQWIKKYTWAEYNVTEASTKQAVKGCRVKQGGCALERQLDDFYALPMMNYGK